TTSSSQSTRTSMRCCTCPLESPLRHSSDRLRLQYTIRPSTSVRSSASRFAHASIRTSPLSASCVMTGIRPRSSNRSASRLSSSMSSPPHRDPLGVQEILDLADRQLLEVEPARGEHGIGLALDQRLGEVLDGTG